MLLTGDLGFMALEPMSERFPDRFINVGVAEQNMVGVATGLAEAGFIPYVYSIATFASLRAYEFIRNGPILHHLPVRIVGVGGGFEYGTNNLTHYGLEDVGIMRIQPGLTVLAPADHEQAAAMTGATWDLPGPVYYRLGKDDRTVVPGLNGRFRLGCGEMVCEGADLLLLAMGPIAGQAVAASAALADRGISCSVMVVSTLSPPPADDLASVLSRFSAALTVEAHYVTGGLGSLVAEVIAERGIGCSLTRCGVFGVPDSVTGSQKFMERQYGLSTEQLIDSSLRALGVVPPHPVERRRS